HAAFSSAERHFMQRVLQRHKCGHVGNFFLIDRLVETYPTFVRSQYIIMLDAIGGDPNDVTVLPRYAQIRFVDMIRCRQEYRERSKGLFPRLTLQSRDKFCVLHEGIKRFWYYMGCVVRHVIIPPFLDVVDDDASASL